MIDRPRGRPADPATISVPDATPDEIRVPLTGVRQTRDLPVTLDESATLCLNLDRTLGGFRARRGDLKVYPIAGTNDDAASLSPLGVWGLFQTAVGAYPLIHYWVQRARPELATVGPVRQRKEFLRWAQNESETVFLIGPNGWVIVRALGRIVKYVGSTLVIRPIGPWLEEYALAGFLQIGRNVIRYSRARETSTGDWEFEGLSLTLNEDLGSVDALADRVNAPVWWVHDAAVLEPPRIESAAYEPSVSRSQLTAVALAPMVNRVGIWQNEATQDPYEDYEYPPEQANWTPFSLNIGEWSNYAVFQTNHDAMSRSVRGGLHWAGLTNYQAAIPIIPKNRPAEHNSADSIRYTASDPKNYELSRPPAFPIPPWYFETDFNSPLYGRLIVDFLRGWTQENAFEYNSNTQKVEFKRANNYWANGLLFFSFRLYDQPSFFDRVGGMGALWAFLPPRFRIMPPPPIAEFNSWHLAKVSFFSRGSWPQNENHYATARGAIPLLTPTSDIYEGERVLWGYKGENDGPIDNPVSNYSDTAGLAAYGFKTTRDVRGGVPILCISARMFPPMGSKTMNWYLRFIAPVCENPRNVPQSAIAGAWVYTRSPADQTDRKTRYEQPPEIQGLDRFYPHAGSDPAYNPPPASLTSLTWPALRSWFESIKPLWDTMLQNVNGRLCYLEEISQVVTVDPNGVEVTIPLFYAYNVGSTDLKSAIQFFAVRAVETSRGYAVPAHWDEDDLIPMEWVDASRFTVKEREFTGGWQGASAVRRMLYVEAENLTLRIPKTYAGAKIGGLLIRVVTLGWADTPWLPTWSRMPDWRRHISSYCMIADPLGMSFYWGQPTYVLGLPVARPQFFSGYAQLSPTDDRFRWARPLRHMFQWCYQLDFRPIQESVRFEQLWAAIRRGRVYSFASKPFVLQSRFGSRLRVVVSYPKSAGLRDEDVVVIASSYASDQPMILYEATFADIKNGVGGATYRETDEYHQFTIYIDDPVGRRAVAFSEERLPYGSVINHMNRYVVYDGASVWVSRFNEPIFQVYSTRPEAGFVLTAPESGAFLSRTDGKPYLIGENASYLLHLESPRESAIVNVRSVFRPVSLPCRSETVVEDYALEWDRVSEQGRPALWVLPYNEFSPTDRPLSVGLFRFERDPCLFLERRDRYELYIYRDTAGGWLLWTLDKAVVDTEPRVVSVTMVDGAITIASPFGLGLHPTSDHMVVRFGLASDLVPNARYRSGAIRLHRGLRIRKAAIIANTNVECIDAPVYFRHYARHDDTAAHDTKRPVVNKTFAVRTSGHKHYALYLELEWIDPRATIVRIELIPSKGYNW